VISDQLSVVGNASDNRALPQAQLTTDNRQLTTDDALGY
jgi:hypothetical protein